MIPLKSCFPIVQVLICLLLLTQCSKDTGDEIPENLVPTGRSKTYQLFASDSSGSPGTATFIENEGGYITADLNLTNTQSGNRHPAYLHRFTAAEGGGRALQLGTVDGDTGKSSITFFKLNDGARVSFDDILEFDGYINVVLSESNQSVDVSQGDIGINELTGKSVVIDLGNEEEGIIGTASFNERVNGTTLLVVGLENDPSAGDYPCHIHYGNSDFGGGIAVSLQPMDGSVGFGQSQVEVLDDGMPISYDELIVFNGHVDIHQSSGGNGQVVAAGDIVSE